MIFLSRAPPKPLEFQAIYQEHRVKRMKEQAAEIPEAAAVRGIFAEEVKTSLVVTLGEGTDLLANLKTVLAGKHNIKQQHIRPHMQK